MSRTNRPEPSNRRSFRLAPYSKEQRRSSRAITPAHLDSIDFFDDDETIRRRNASRTEADLDDSDFGR